MKHVKISEPTTHRLSIYLRCLDTLNEAGLLTVSSRSMADQFDLNSAQIRKDLAYFGQFGVRGKGYSVPDLRHRVARILGLDMEHRVCIVGAGNLGMALSEYHGFSKSGFHIVALFDMDPKKVGMTSRAGVPIYDVRELVEVVESKGISMGMIAVPAEAAQQACSRMVNGGIRAILNFAPARLTVPSGIKVRSIDLSISLEGLSFFLAREALSISEPIAARTEYAASDPSLD